MDHRTTLHTTALFMLYAGGAAFAVPVLLVPGFLDQVLGADAWKAVLLLFGPYAFVTLLTAVNALMDGRREHR